MGPTRPIPGRAPILLGYGNTDDDVGTRWTPSKRSSTSCGDVAALSPETGESAMTGVVFWRDERGGRLLRGGASPAARRVGRHRHFDGPLRLFGGDGTGRDVLLAGRPHTTPGASATPWGSRTTSSTAGRIPPGGGSTRSSGSTRRAGRRTRASLQRAPEIRALLRKADELGRKGSRRGITRSSAGTRRPMRLFRLAGRRKDQSYFSNRSTPTGCGGSGSPWGR